jgi:hypothetical protein
MDLTGPRILCVDSVLPLMCLWAFAVVEVLAPSILAALALAARGFIFWCPYGRMNVTIRYRRVA